MVGIVEGITEGGQVFPDPVERGVRSSIFGQTAVALGETAASGARAVAGVDEFEVTFGSSPLGSGRYDFGDGSVEVPGTGGGTGTPISRLAGMVITNLPSIVGGVVVLVVIYALGNLFTINVGDSTS
jgi:hypothetical protein